MSQEPKPAEPSELEKEFQYLSEDQKVIRIMEMLRTFTSAL